MVVGVFIFQHESASEGSLITLNVLQILNKKSISWTCCIRSLCPCLDKLSMSLKTRSNLARNAELYSLNTCCHLSHHL